MPYFFASAVDSMISSGVIFLSMASRIFCEPDSTPRLRRWQPARRISRRSSSPRTSTRVSQLQKKRSLRSRIPWQSATTRFLFVVKVSSLIWIIFTGARATAFSSASSTYGTEWRAEARGPSVVSAPQKVQRHGQPREVITMCVSK